MRKLLSLLTAVLFLFVFTACSNVQPDNTGNQTPNSEIDQLLKGGTATDSPQPTQLVTPEKSPVLPGDANMPLTAEESNTQVQSAAQTGKLADYFPFIKDRVMYYEGKGNEFAEYQTEVEFLTKDRMQLKVKNPGTSSVEVYEYRDGEIRKVFTKGEVYYRYDFTGFTGTKETILKEPLKVGTSWKLPNGSKRSITAINKSIATPYGKFKALETTTENKDSKVYDYYVTGIGKVMSVFENKETGDKISSSLKQIKKDTPATYTVRFYYPTQGMNFTNNMNEAIRYVDKKVSLLTNQSMKYVFQREFKKVPEGSKLVKVLPPNVKVNAISLDTKKETVTVDLSSNFVKDLNAGTTFESLVLRSITNTIGGFYQVRKVIITLDGKPYSSGHYEMKPGEAFEVDTKGIKAYQ